MDSIESTDNPPNTLTRHSNSARTGESASKGIVQMTVNLSSDFTIVKAVGKVSEYDLLFWIEEYYAGETTSLVLWDLVGADLSEMESKITTEQIVTYIRMFNEAAVKVRKGGKTAFVVRDDSAANRLFLQVESLAQTMDSPIGRKTFTNFIEAKQWLGI